MSKKTTQKTESLGDRIKKLRRDRDWSRQDLASKIGSHLQTINRYEYGTSLPSADVLQKLAEVFRVTTDYLIFGESDAVATSKIKNKELLKRVEQLDRINPNVIKDLLGVMDVYIRENTVKEALVA